MYSFTKAQFFFTRTWQSIYQKRSCKRVSLARNEKKKKRKISERRYISYGDAIRMQVCFYNRYNRRYHDTGILYYNLHSGQSRAMNETHLFRWNFTSFNLQTEMKLMNFLALQQKLLVLYEDTRLHMTAVDSNSCSCADKQDP